MLRISVSPLVTTSSQDLTLTPAGPQFSVIPFKTIILSISVTP